MEDVYTHVDRKRYEHNVYIPYQRFYPFHLHPANPMELANRINRIKFIFLIMRNSAKLYLSIRLNQCIDCI